MVTLGCKSARERLGQLILELYLRLERAGRAADWRCEFPLSQQHLADFTGMTAVHVCRTLRGLRREQLADVHGRKLSILDFRSEEHTSELQSLMRISYAVFCLKQKKNVTSPHHRQY